MNARTAAREPAAERSRAWELSVASGLQAGARARLDPIGSWSVGPDESDDLVLRDPGLGAARVLLRREPGGATLRVVSGDVGLGPEPVTVDRTVALAPGAALRLGGVTLELAETCGEDVSAVPAPALARVTTAKRSVPSPTRGRALACAGVAVLALAAIGAALPLAPGQRAPRQPERASVESLLAGAGFAELGVSRSDGLPVVDGVLADDAAVRRLEALLSPGGAAWVNRVETDASVATQVLDVLRVNGVDAELIDSGGGTVGVRTALPASRDLAALRDKVRADVPALAALEIENVPPPVAVRRAAPPSDPGKRVAMVVAGPPAHVVTEDRTRYFVGAVLPSGHRIVGIEGDRVALERDGESTVLDF